MVHARKKKFYYFYFRNKEETKDGVMIFADKEEAKEFNKGLKKQKPNEVMSSVLSGTKYATYLPKR